MEFLCFCKRILTINNWLNECCVEIQEQISFWASSLIHLWSHRFLDASSLWMPLRSLDYFLTFTHLSYGLHFLNYLTETLSKIEHQLGRCSISIFCKEFSPRWIYSPIKWQRASHSLPLPSSLNKNLNFFKMKHLDQES